MTEVLKEYLVKLGFKVDNKQFDDFRRILNSADRQTKTFSASMISNMSTAELAILSFVVASNAGIASYIGSLARADLDTELFARRMWITADQGKAIQESLKATGRSMEDVWFSPELRAQFIELQKVAQEIKPPEEFKDQMKEIRNVQLEFMKLRVILAYAAQWIGHYLIKYLAEPIAKVKQGMIDLNAYIKANMPTLSQDVAHFLSGFVSMGESVVWAISNIIKMINELPGNVKMAGAAMVGIFAFIASGPIGMMLAGLSLLMLLLEDFYVFSQGGKSALPGMWTWVEDTFGKGSGFAVRFGDDVEYLNTKLGELYDVMSKLLTAFDRENVFSHLIDALGAVYNLVKEVVKYLLMIDDRRMAIFNPNKKIEITDQSAAGIAQDTNWLLDAIRNFSNSATGLITGQSPVQHEGVGRSFNSTQTINNTNNIYGSDAYAIGSQVNRNLEEMSTNMRDVQGVFR